MYIYIYIYIYMELLKSLFYSRDDILHSDMLNFFDAYIFLSHLRSSINTYLSARP